MASDLRIVQGQAVFPYQRHPLVSRFQNRVKEKIRVSLAVVVAQSRNLMTSSRNASSFTQNSVSMLFQNTDHIIFVSGRVFNIFSCTSGVLSLIITDKLC